MKSIAWVNITVPSNENTILYGSSISLGDYDIVIFDPQLPYYERIQFSGGGSCISIEGGNQFKTGLSHWSHELVAALKVGKTVFVPLNTCKEDLIAIGSNMKARNQRTYDTANISNYAVFPGNLKPRNSCGKHVVVKDSAFKGLYDAIKEIAGYRVVFEANSSMRTVFSDKNGASIGGVLRFPNYPGSLVLLPHFDFDQPHLTESGDESGPIWSKKAIQIFDALVRQLLAVDRNLKNSTDLIPVPDWLKNFESPKIIKEIDETVNRIGKEMEQLRLQLEFEKLRKIEVLQYSHLLYETGKPLERAIEKVLHLLDYEVETLRVGALEIVHVIVSPSGMRMIGESEGKDSNAIDIAKFRQLESNIGEDFAREEVDQLAKGVLFGNGFRLSDPNNRAMQFTEKSLTNAKRVGTALVQTADLYPLALHLLNHPNDHEFKTACRSAIENTPGGVVSFPDPNTSSPPIEH